MKCLYEKTFSQSYDGSLSANKFWEEHNKIKENAFGHRFGKINISFFIPKDKGHEELLRYTEETTRASVVVYSRYLSNYCDDIFDVGIVR